MSNIKACLLVAEDSIDYGGDTGVATLIIDRLKVYAKDTLLSFDKSYVTRNEFPESVELYDAYVLTGSHYSANSTFPWIERLKQFVVDIKKSSSQPRLFSICFGHQVTVKAFGGKVGVNKSNELTWCCNNVHVTEKLSREPYFENAFGQNINNIKLMQSHYDQITEMPSNGVTVASSKGCAHEIILYGDNILTMQGHPEIPLEKMLNHGLPLLKSKNVLSREQEEHALNSFKSFTLEHSDNLMKFIIEFLIFKQK